MNKKMIPDPAEEQKNSQSCYRRTLQNLAQMTEAIIRELHEDTRERNGENIDKKDLPTQLLKLTQLLEKILNLVEKLEPEAAQQEEKIPYQLIWKYLRKKCQNDSELS
jgi:tRNA uridine 5-carbamoylmethylation protein Kti12